MNKIKLTEVCRLHAHAQKRYRQFKNEHQK
jgi:hypothetical protein